MNNNNVAVVSGKFLGPIVEDHVSFGEKFYAGILQSKRTSGAIDSLRVNIPGKVLDIVDHDILTGAVTINGHVRSYSKIVDGVGHLDVVLYAKGIEACNDDETQNDITLVGAICKQPKYRVTPFGREICDLMLAVDRGFMKSDYIPSIAWGSNGKWAAHLNIGDRVTVRGRFQSREYNKVLENGETIVKTAYELSVFFIEKVHEEYDNEDCAV